DHGVPVWSPDGNRILFGALQGKVRRGIYQKPSNGAGGEELLLPSENSDTQIWPTSWSRDGRFVLYTRGLISLSQADIRVLPLEGTANLGSLSRRRRPLMTGSSLPIADGWP